MKRTLVSLGLLTAVSILAVGYATPARAQCSFQRPAQAKAYSTTLVAAFPETDSIAETTHNTSSIDGRFANSPPLILGQHFPPTTPAAGWRWKSSQTRGTFDLKILTSPPRLQMNLDLRKVLDATGSSTSYADGNGLGMLRLTIRTTQNGQSGTLDLTAEDHVVEVPLRAIGALNGTVYFETGFTQGATVTIPSFAIPTGLGSPPLVLNDCTSMEVRNVEIFDVDGKLFAVGGLHIPIPSGTLPPILPSLPCQFQHPLKAGKMQFDLVQAFTECAAPTTTTGPGVAGVPACPPPVSVVESSGGGWYWDTAKGRGSVQFKVVKGGGENGALGLNGETNPNNVGDVKIALKLQSVRDSLDADNLADGPGSLLMTWRFTLYDRTLEDMTVSDLPTSVAFDLHDGKAYLKATLNTILNNVALQDLPGCTTAQLVGVEVQDENSLTFAVPGLRTN